MAASDKRSKTINSKYHPERQCSSECALCGKSSLHYSHYGGLGETEKDYCKHHWGKELCASSCICKAHYQEALRKGKNPCKKLNKPQCVHPSCSCDHEARLIAPSFASSEELTAALHICENQQVFLCTEHYQELYRQFRSPMLCASCGALPKRGNPFTRHSPNARLVNQICGFDGDEITESDIICLSCYKNHLAIIRSFEESSSRGSPTSLESLITLWEVSYTSITDKITQSVLHTVLYVAKELLNQRAILLPHVCELFLTEYLQSKPESTQYTLKGTESTINFTSKWLLKQLIVYLHLHMEHTCVHKRFGTMLYSKGGDLRTSLSWALGRSSSHAELPCTFDFHSQTTGAVAQTLGDAGDLINDMVHEEIMKVHSEDCLPDMNIDDEIAKINPLLWLFLEAITRTTRERQGSKAENSSSIVKKLRRYFIFSLIMFCTNTQKAPFIHTLLADTLVMCGGSRKLMKIMNRIGVTSSPDTHDRFVTDVAQAQRDKTVWDALPGNTLTIASADNFDKLQSHAAVYCGDQYRSYHGTTLQLVQPNPDSELPHIAASDKELEPPPHTAATLPSDLSHTATANGENVLSELSHTAAIVNAENVPQSPNIKRQVTCSPASSPHQLGKTGPKRPRTLKPRTVTEQVEHAGACFIDSPMVGTSNTVTREGFLEQTHEKAKRKSLETQAFVYMYAKHSLSLAQPPQQVHFDFKDIYAHSHSVNRLESNIHYMELIDENPDCSETMKYVSELLLNTFSDHQNGYVVLVGDGKTYEHLMDVKRIYGNSLSKLLIFPGDWHTLKNYQPVLLKIYYHVGLKELAQGSGFKGETLKSLESCSNFKRTHKFLVQAWESLFMGMLGSFLHDHNPSIPPIATDTDFPHSLENLESLIVKAGALAEFRKYATAMGANDATWNFWYDFVFKDCLYYVQLHLAIRCQDWDLRMSSLKLMAPVFKAYDRTTYQKLIPNHLANLQTFPPTILASLKNGFTVAIKGGKGHAVALDEAHEMCVNKDLKMAIIHPTQSYLQKTSLFLRYRISVHKNLLKQLFPSDPDTDSPSVQLVKPTPGINVKEENVGAMIRMIELKGLFPSSAINRGLVNVFSETKATPQQSHDLLNFRKVGYDSLMNFIDFCILKIPSTTAPVRSHKLLTMAAPRKTGKRLMSHKEKELKQVTACLRQRLAWCNRTKQSYDANCEQYSLLPRSICDEKGNPHVGQKAVWKDKLKQRYSGFGDPVVFENLEPKWKPEVTMIDAMFTIQCKPLRSNKSISAYAIMLFERFCIPHFRDGAHEVHLIFDTTSQLGQFNPKLCEQKRRDGEKIASHQHIDFSPSTTTPAAWQSVLTCRQCKRSLVEAIGLSYMQLARFQLKRGQTLVLSGCFDGTSAFRISEDMLPIHDPRYDSNAIEADMRIWRHVSQCPYKRILVYSPDTDVYNVGMPLVAQNPSREVMVQLNIPRSQVSLYINLNSLVRALSLDPDLACAPTQCLPQIIQMLYICSGCDYVSYFYGQGKASFFNTFFQNAAFICRGHLDGLLSDISPNTLEKGYLAFLRLIGTLYFKKHLAGMVCLKEVETPTQLFNAHPSSDINQQHLLWYADIRSIVSERITSEEERMPSHTSMWRHWLRSCWVARLWNNSPEEDLFTGLPAPESSGWKRQDDGSYAFDWECPSVQHSIQNTIDFLTKGCSCRKGCRSQRCGCRKNERSCGPGCQCQGCTNVPVPEPRTSTQRPSHEQLSEAGSSSEEETDDRNSETEIEIISFFDDECYIDDCLA